MWRILQFVAWLAASKHAVMALDGKTCHESGGLEYCASDQKCHPDGICSECDGRLTEDTDSHECIDRVVFHSHVAFDAVGVVIWFSAAGLAISAGVGGGGIFVPLGVVLLRFAPKPSTALSHISIFGASLAGLILNIRARHPKADRPMIDLDMALFLAPMQMAGALLGVIIQIVLPNWAVIVVMAVVLAFMAMKTFQKGCQTWKKERAAKRAANQSVQDMQQQQELQQQQQLRHKEAWAEEPSQQHMARTSSPTEPTEPQEKARTSSPTEPIEPPIEPEDPSIQDFQKLPDQQSGMSNASVVPVANFSKSRSVWSISTKYPLQRNGLRWNPKLHIVTLVT